MGHGVILGDWTHRRGDVGGTRAVSADVLKAKPEVAWSWRPEHGGRVDQVRIAGECVYVATMRPDDTDAPGWEHAVVYALDAATGRVMARRPLPDPVPVAAMLCEAGLVHVIATRKGEPIFSYALEPGSLVPRHRRLIELDRDARRDDVLDAWGLPDGGLWLEIERASGTTGGRAYAHVCAGDNAASAQTHEDDVASGEWGTPARDACCVGSELFAPVRATTPAVWRVKPVSIAPHEVAHGRTLMPPARDTWVRADVTGASTQAHLLSAEGAVFVVAAGDDPDRDGRVHIQLIAMDRASEVERFRTAVARVPIRTELTDIARCARRPNGEILFQSIDQDGAAGSDLVCLRSDGSIDAIPMGNGRRYLLDAALGDLVLAHHERNGRVVVAGFEIDREGRLLGRRTAQKWSVMTEDLGGEATVYAGAGKIVVRGASGIAAIAV
jgi:hypothetical protein